MNPLSMEPLRLDPEPHTGRVQFRDDYWTWCRRHQRAERASEPRTCGCDEVEHVWIHSGCPTSCVRIGPFMSEREANRLGWDADGDLRGPLGMEVEE